MGAAAPFIAIGASILSTAVSAVGQIQAANAQAAQAKYQAAVAKNNAAIAARSAADSRERGGIEAQNKLREGAAMIGRQNAAFAANGVLVNAGSAIDITSDTAAASQQDALTIKNNAEREALGYETQGMNFKAESALYKRSAANTMNALPFALAGTLLNGAGSVAGKWYDFYGSKGG